ncbi:mitochondrial carrier domain-containing protein [Absidia repens]|uniref:Mitochondrial carrier domain-containing protein n=1 Tax=Absidia repens TaxID=90262 RepID=A0A1X2IIT3_9FUNG|nr:mitochondrial carrier domain-containing protein [Absidia repens]
MTDGYTVFASSIAAISARLCTHPIDTIKTRLQANNQPRTPGQSYGQWLTFIITQGNTTHSSAAWKVPRQLYSGLSVTLLFSVPALSVYLSCYEASKRYLDQHNLAAHDKLANHMLSGGAAEIMAGTLFTPMEVLKNQLQTTTSASAKTIMNHEPPSHHVRSTNTATAWPLAKKIFRQEGLAGFYRGYWMGLVVFLPHTMIYFATYEHLKSLLSSNNNDNNNNNNNNQPFSSTSAATTNVSSFSSSSSTSSTTTTNNYASHLPWTYYLVASSTASLVSSALSAPLDIIKTRWQVSASDQGKAYRQGPWQIAKQLWLLEGRWKGLTKGLGARVIWAIPTTAISMTVFEIVKDYRRFLL